MQWTNVRRATIYARFSTEMQSDRSIDDQVALCRTYAEREGFAVSDIYSDRARTSASIMGRDGLLELMEAAKTGAFDAVIVESLDRISRDMEDLAGIHKRLSFWGVDIIGVHDGRADMLQVGMRAIMGQMELANHKHRVRRGMTGLLSAGRHAGGRAYGYRVVAGQVGELEIVEEEADVIRRIFAAYVAGQTPRAIAGDLNADGIPAPRGSKWNASTISGNRARGYGILHNQLYVGEIVWNKVTMALHPDTGKRISRTNSPEKWMRAPAPKLRIVSDDLFQRAAARQAERSHKQQGRRGRGIASPSRPFSGLLKCGECGGGVSISKRRGAQIWCRCSTKRESGTCANGREMRLDKIEAAVFDHLAEELRDPVYVKAYLAEYHAERKRLAAGARADRSKLERAAVKARAAYDRAHHLYITGVTDGPDAEANIRALLDKSRAAEKALDTAGEEPQVVEIHPTALARYNDALVELSRSLTNPDQIQNDNAVTILRELVESIVVTPQADKSITIDVNGRLANLIGDAPPSCRVSMVAEEGLEPPTRGL